MPKSPCIMIKNAEVFLLICSMRWIWSIRWKREDSTPLLSGNKASNAKIQTANRRCKKAPVHSLEYWGFFTYLVDALKEWGFDLCFLAIRLLIPIKTSKPQMQKSPSVFIKNAEAFFTYLVDALKKWGFDLCFLAIRLLMPRYKQQTADAKKPQCIH